MATPLADSERNIILLYESEVIYEKFRQVFGSRYSIFWGKDLNSTIDILSSRTVGVMVCDIHFHNQDIYPVVLALKAMHPELVTMIVTQSKDASLVAELEAQEEIYAALIRPVTQEKLNQTLDDAFQYYLKNRKAIVDEMRAKEAAEETSASASAFSGMSLSDIIASRMAAASQEETVLPDDILALDSHHMTTEALPDDIRALDSAVAQEPAADATAWLDELDVSNIDPAASHDAAAAEWKEEEEPSVSVQIDLSGADSDPFELSDTAMPAAESAKTSNDAEPSAEEADDLKINIRGRDRFFEDIEYDDDE